MDTLVPHSWQLWASTLSCVSCTCFCSMYSVTYFLSHTEHVHCLPTSHAHGAEEEARVVSGLSRRVTHPAVRPRDRQRGLLPSRSPVATPMSENFAGLTFWGRGATVQAEQHQNIRKGLPTAPQPCRPHRARSDGLSGARGGRPAGPQVPRLPVWMSLCVSIVFLSLKVFPHSSHMKSLIPAEKGTLNFTFHECLTTRRSCLVLDTFLYLQKPHGR